MSKVPIELGNFERESFIKKKKTFGKFPFRRCSLFFFLDQTVAANRDCCVSMIGGESPFPSASRLDGSSTLYKKWRWASAVYSLPCDMLVFMDIQKGREAKKGVEQER